MNRLKGFDNFCIKFLTAALLCGLSANVRAAENDVSPLPDKRHAIVNREIKALSSPEFAYEKKKITFAKGDAFDVYRLSSFRSRDNAVPFCFELPGRSGTASYYENSASEWRTLPLDGRLPDAVLFVETDSAAMMVGPAVLYRRFGDGNLQDVGRHGAVSVSRTETGYRFSVSISFEEGTEAQFWTLQSSETGLQHEDGRSSLWSRLNFIGRHRLCYDGAYSETPASYVPSGEEMFFRSPAVHAAGVLVSSEDNFAADLSVILLDEAISHQNGEGYWPTPCESKWLREEYGIGSGFYDTRFNNGVTMSLFMAFRKFGEQRYLEAALRQADWLILVAREHHMPAGNGILVEDYYCSGGAYKPTHCSLNHQLQEIKVMLTAYELTSDPKYANMAESMLNGIRSTENKWISREKGLEYAIMPDGSVGLQDYPCLTYNDLFEVQEMLERKGGRDSALDRLMASKLRHMLINGIEDYLTYEESDMPDALKSVYRELDFYEKTA